MKVKNALYILTLFTIPQLDARVLPQGYQPGVTPPTQQVPGQVPVPQAPAITNKFQPLLQKIKNPATKVINANGMIEQDLVTEIRNADLVPELTRALFEAAVTIRLPLNSENDADTAGQIKNALNQIDGLMGQTKKETSTMVIDYDKSTRLIKKEYLDNFIKEAVSSDKSQQQYENELQAFEKQVKAAWDKDQSITQAMRYDLSVKLNQQLENAAAQIDMLKKTPSRGSDAFYDKKTNLFDQAFLNRQIELKRQHFPYQEGLEKELLGELMPMITNAWKKQGITVSLDQVDKARRQIILSITKIYRGESVYRGEIASLDNQWYDAWTHLLEERYLDHQVRQAFQKPSNKDLSLEQLLSMILNTALKSIRPLWEKEKLNIIEYSAKLENQIKASLKKVMQEEPRKKDLDEPWNMQKELFGEKNASGDLVTLPTVKPNKPGKASDFPLIQPAKTEVVRPLTTTETITEYIKTIFANAQTWNLTRDALFVKKGDTHELEWDNDAAVSINQLATVILSKFPLSTVAEVTDGILEAITEKMAETKEIISGRTLTALADKIETYLELNKGKNQLNFIEKTPTKKPDPFAGVWDEARAEKIDVDEPAAVIKPEEEDPTVIAADLAKKYADRLTKEILDMGPGQTFVNNTLLLLYHELIQQAPNLKLLNANYVANLIVQAISKHIRQLNAQQIKMIQEQIQANW
jgi:hypothetical protein